MSTSVPDDQTPLGAGAGAPAQEQVEVQALLRELATTVALLPQEAPLEGEERPEDAIALPVIEQDGTQYIPVFTSEDALQAVGADPVAALRLPLAQLAVSWPGEDLWLAINPGSEDGLTLPSEVVQSLPRFIPGLADDGQLDEGQQATG
jgi:hypothetical protein